MILFLILGAGAVAWTVRDHLTTPFDACFAASGKRYGVDSNLLRAIGRRETGHLWKSPLQAARAISPVNSNGSRDYGVMQLSSPNLAGLGLTTETALDPVRNIDAAARFVAGLRLELGTSYNQQALISAYNQGAPRVKSSGILNGAYVAVVKTHYELYQLGRMFA